MAIRRPGTGAKPTQQAHTPAKPESKPEPKSAPETALATAEPVEATDIVIADDSSALPDYLSGYEEDRRGKENITPEDAGTPRIRLLQPTSAEVQGVGKGEGKGAENGYVAGELYFAPLDMLLGKEMTFVVLAMDKEWVRFGDLKTDGAAGLLWKMKPSEVDKHPERRQDMEWQDKKPPKAQFTYNFLVMLYDQETDTLDEQIGLAVLSLAKTQTPCAQTLCQSLLTAKGPSFVRAYTVKSRMVKYTQGAAAVLDARPAGFVGSKETADRLSKLVASLSGKDFDVDYSDAEPESDPGQHSASSVADGNF